MKTEMVISIVAALFSGVSAYVAYRSYKNIVKNNASLAQLDLVIELYKNIQESKFEIQLSSLEKSGINSAEVLRCTLFDLPKIDLDEYLECPIVFGHGSNQIIDSKKYLNNPLTPKKIADYLEDFHSKSSDPQHFRNFRGSKLLILKTNIFLKPSNSNFQETIHEFRSDIKSEALNKGYLHFYNYANNLKQAISDWFDEFGIEDLNTEKRNLGVY